MENQTKVTKFVLKDSSGQYLSNRILSEDFVVVDSLKSASFFNDISVLLYWLQLTAVKSVLCKSGLKIVEVEGQQVEYEWREVRTL